MIYLNLYSMINMIILLLFFRESEIEKVELMNEILTKCLFITNKILNNNNDD